MGCGSSPWRRSGSWLSPEGSSLWRCMRTCCAADSSKGVCVSKEVIRRWRSHRVRSASNRPMFRPVVEQAESVDRSHCVREETHDESTAHVVGGCGRSPCGDAGYRAGRPDPSRAGGYEALYPSDLEGIPAPVLA